MISWKGIENNSETIENLKISNDSKNIKIKSVVNGFKNNHPIAIKYFLNLNLDWNFTSVKIESLLDSKPDIQLKVNSDGKWFNENNLHLEQLEGATDIDISITPFTNSLPINRLKEKLKERTELTVVYIDLLNWNIHSVKQYYTKLQDQIFYYEGVSSGFKSKIFTDENGIVLNYPDLFERVN